MKDRELLHNASQTCQPQQWQIQQPSSQQATYALRFSTGNLLWLFFPPLLCFHVYGEDINSLLSHYMCISFWITFDLIIGQLDHEIKRFEYLNCSV